MTFSGIVALIGGVVTAGCAIAGIVSGIRARKAAERQAEEMRRAEHEARLEEIRCNNNRNYIQGIQYIPYQQPAYQQPVNNEVHYYYHNIPQPQQYYMQPQQNYQQYQQQTGYYPSTGYAYNEPVYRGEQEIGLASRMQLFQNLRNWIHPQYQYQQQYNYYPQANYAYAL